jgi:hypothetical protein
VLSENGDKVKTVMQNDLHGKDLIAKILSI